MKLVYGISRWTNPSRASARHIDGGNGKPLCSDKRKVLSWETEEGEPTCNYCIRIFTKGNILIKDQETKLRGSGLLEPLRAGLSHS